MADPVKMRAGDSMNESDHHADGDEIRAHVEFIGAKSTGTVLREIHLAAIKGDGHF
jgi:hypothetical protein